MKGKRFAEERIIGMLKESHAAAATNELSRQYGINEQTICRWGAKFGGMRVGDSMERQAAGDATPVRFAGTRLSGGLHRTELMIPELA